MSQLLDSVLDAERMADIRENDLIAAEQTLVVRGEPYIWPQVPWRNDAPARRRDEPRASRWGDLS